MIEESMIREKFIKDMIVLRSFCLISQRDLGLRKRWRIKFRLVLEVE